MTLLQTILVALQASEAVAAPHRRTDYTSEAIAGAKAMNQNWYNTNNGLWDNAWWNSGNALTTLADLTKLHPQQAASLNLTGIIQNTFTKAQRTNVATVKTKPNGMLETSDCIDGHGKGCSQAPSLAARGFANFLNDYYDDEGWWALGLIHSYDATGNHDYLNAAVNIFKDMQTGLGGPCNGGIYWSKDRNYVNAIANELYLTVAASLGNRIPSDKSHYIDIAKSQWKWFSNSGMINGKNLVNDGLTDDCKNNGRDTWTYNQGVLLGGLAELYKATNDGSYLDRAETIAKAAMAALVDSNGVLIEANRCDVGISQCSHDLEQFKGIFVRNLRYLNEVRSRSEFKSFILRNADAVWSKDRNGDNKLGVSWDGPYFDATIMTQSSALDALVAASAVA